MPTFYSDILTFFKELKCLYSLGDQLQDLISYNNQDILIEGKSIYYSEWLEKGILSIRDLLDENGCFLSLQDFNQKYHCHSIFLHLYQVMSAIPKHLLIKARNCEQTIEKEYYIRSVIHPNSPLMKLLN